MARLLCLGMAVVLVAWDSVHGGSEIPADLVNVALGRACTFTTEPNYGPTNCKDEPPTECEDDDTLDLTDGLHYSGQSKLWTSLDTVGWSYVYKPIGIHLDLGEVQVIDTLRISGGCGASGAFFPAAILAYVSSDGIDWSYVTNLTTEPVPQYTYIYHTFEKAGLAATGRYVALYALATGPFVFVDELEVLASASDSLNDTPGAVIPTDGLPADAEARLPLAVEMTTGIYLLGAADDAIQSAPGGDADAAMMELDAIRQDILAATEPWGVRHEDGMPYTILEEDAFRVAGAYMAEAGLPKAAVWKFVEDVAPLTPFDRPVGDAPVELSIEQMINEHAYASFHVSNNTPDWLEVDLSAVTEIGAPTVTFREGFFVLAPGYQFIPDARPEILDGELWIAPGMTVEVGVELDGKAAVPGVYEIPVSVLPDGGSATTVSLEVEVFDILMPDVPGYRSASFAFFADEHLSQFPQEVADDLAAHYSNVQLLNSAQLPYPFLDENGDPIDHLPFDFSDVDAVMDLRPDVEFWVLMVTAENTPVTELLEGQNAADEAAFKEWVVAIDGHMTERGLTHEQWAFFWTDEPTVSEWEDYIAPASEWTKEVNGSILIWQNWNSEAVENLILESDGLVDIHVPSTSRFSDELDLTGVDPDEDLLLERLALKDRRAWMYDSASSVARDPFTDYIYSHWLAWALELDGYCKWVYLDSDQDIWNEYDTSIYAMVYPSDEGVIPSARWEAWRDGVEDAELLRQADSAAAHDGSVASYVTSTRDALLTGTDDPSFVDTMRSLLLSALTNSQPCLGDVNGDGAVDPLDAGYVQARTGCQVGVGDATCDAADANGDGAVDPLDVGYLQARFGNCQ